MSLVNQQNAFLNDVALLIQKAPDFGIKLTAGEFFRTQEQQDLYLAQGKSKIKHSRHQDRMAVDFNFFVLINGQWSLTYNKSVIQPLGDYWESLSPFNEWGGNWDSFQDVPHFQRNDE